ncbi:MAG: universal stress protein, partial [Cyanobacteria bacterium J06632_3]
VSYLSELSQKYLADIRYRFEVVSGVVSEEMLAVASANSATDIVLGKSVVGESGSVARAVIEGSSCRVLIVPGATR